MSQRLVRYPLWYPALILALIVTAISPAAPANAGWGSLTGILPLNASIGYGWGFSPDGLYVIYVADAEVAGRNELYSVSVAGGAPVKLNAGLVTGGDVTNFAVTPDSQYVVYIADQEVDQRSELYRVPITGGSVVRLSSPLPVGGNVQSLKIDPDNVRVVYVADGTSNDVYELYSVPIAGGGAVRLNPAPVSGGNIYNYEVDPFSNRVVFTGDLIADSRIEIFAAPIAGGSSVQLNPLNSRVEPSFQLDPSLPVVVFSATPSGSSSVNLYMNTTDGSVLTTLNGALASNQDVFGFKITPDGARVIYNITTMTSTLFVTSGNLHSVLIGGGASTMITGPAANGYGVYGATFSITSDSQRVVYTYQANAAARPSLASVPVTGGTPAGLYAESPFNETMGGRVVSPDGNWVVLTTTPSYQIWAIPTTGGSPLNLAYGYDPQFTPDSSRVLFVTDSISGIWDLYSMQVFGGGLRNLSRLNGSAGAGAYQISPDGTRVAFVVSYSSDAGSQYEIRISDGGEAQWALYLPSLVR